MAPPLWRHLHWEIEWVRIERKRIAYPEKVSERVRVRECSISRSSTGSRPAFSAKVPLLHRSVWCLPWVASPFPCFWSRQSYQRVLSCRRKDTGPPCTIAKTMEWQRYRVQHEVMYWSLLEVAVHTGSTVTEKWKSYDKENQASQEWRWAFKKTWKMKRCHQNEKTDWIQCESRIRNWWNTVDRLHNACVNYACCCTYKSKSCCSYQSKLTTSFFHCRMNWFDLAKLGLTHPLETRI